MNRLTDNFLPIMRLRAASLSPHRPVISTVLPRPSSPLRRPRPLPSFRLEREGTDPARRGLKARRPGGGSSSGDAT